MEISNISPKHLQDEKLGPRICKAIKKLESETRRPDSYYMLLKGYARSPFRHFESYLGIVVGLKEDDSQLISQRNTSNFVTYDLSPGIYSIKGISEVVYSMSCHEGTLQVKYDDCICKNKTFFNPFWRNI